MSTALEILPGTLEERDLSLVASVLARQGDSPQLVVADGQPVAVPMELVAVLLAIVEQLRAGHGVSVASLHAELTTAEAAELLGVSRPHAVKLLESGAMPFRMVGTHRRVRLVDVLAYRDRQDEQSARALDELTVQAEDFGLYDALPSKSRHRTT